MDAHSLPPGDLNSLEQRLAQWRPSAAGLDADRMLFAAGRASVRPGLGRIAWPIAAGCFALVAVTLGVLLGQERTARLELAAHVGNSRAPSVAEPAAGPDARPAVATAPPARSSYLAARQALAQNLDGWQSWAQGEPLAGSSSPSHPIWRAYRPERALEP